MKKVIDPYIDSEWNVLKNKLGITTTKELRQAETDIAIVKMVEFMKHMNFEASVNYLKYINQYIFGDLYPFAGEIRTIELIKHEPTLQLLPMNYEKVENILSKLELVFEKIISTQYNDLSKKEQVDYISDVISEIWRIHPFREGNTRTTLIFMRALLQSYGLSFSPTQFQSYGNFHFMRNALIAATFEAEDLNVKRDKTYINLVISDIIEDNLAKKRGR